MSPKYRPYPCQPWSDSAYFGPMSFHVGLGLVEFGPVSAKFGPVST